MSEVSDSISSAYLVVNGKLSTRLRGHDLLRAHMLVSSIGSVS